MLMSVSRPSRHFAAKQRFGRFWREADINWQARPAHSVENARTELQACLDLVGGPVAQPPAQAS